MSTPDVNEALVGPLGMGRRRAELDAIAAALEISTSASNKKTLLKQIQTHLEQRPELASQPRFQGLFSYRPESKEKTAPAKNSADRAAEDIAEDAQNPKVPSG